VSALQIAVLAIVQGITEFLPISSSGHLVLVPVFADWPDQGLTIDVAVHVGTLVAVMGYLWREIAAMLAGVGRFAVGQGVDQGCRLAFLLVAATVPVVVAGYFVNKLAGTSLRSVAVIGWSTLIFGVVLHVADRVGATARALDRIGTRDALLIGLSQVLALIPGVSRSGITMTAARFLGFDRQAAARFSMLLSIPTIVGAGVLLGIELYQSGDAALTQDAVWAAVLAGLAAIVAIIAMMAWLRRASFVPFVIYRVILGVALIAYASLHSA
jgi:undecaprenyl-diphosphatase